MSAILVIVAILTLAAFYVLLPVAANEYRKYRGRRLVTCPETGTMASVELDVAHAVVTGTLGTTQLRLMDCTRWPERQECGQPCLRQIEAAPEQCLVRTTLNKWYEDKVCAVCGQPFTRLQVWGNQIALLSPTGKTLQWSELAAERIPEVLLTHKPICWDCHVSDSFRQMNPELSARRPSAAERP